MPNLRLRKLLVVPTKTKIEKINDCVFLISTLSYQAFLAYDVPKVLYK